MRVTTAGAPEGGRPLRQSSAPRGLSVKLLYRRGTAHHALGALDDAWDDLGSAAGMEPANLAVRTGIRKLTAAYAELGGLPPGESDEEYYRDGGPGGSP